MKTVTARDLQKKVKECVDWSQEDRIVITRHGKPAAVMVGVAARVRQGGHNVPRADVLRRFDRSWRHFQESYRLLADAWSVYDNSGRNPRLVERSS